MNSKAVFAIDKDVIKFLQVSVSGSKKLVTAAEAIDIRGHDDARTSARLKDLIALRKLNLAQTQVTVLLPRSRVILRHLSLPSHQEEEIRSMIDLQIGGHIPYVREEVEIDFQVLSKASDGYSKVAVVIVPQEVPARYWKIFSEAGIFIDHMSISSVGLWSLYQQQSTVSDDRLAAIFDLDTGHSEICLCRRSQWLTSRDIPQGLLHLQKEGYVEILKQWELTLNHLGAEKSNEAVESVYLINGERSPQLKEEMTKVQEHLKIKDIMLTRHLELARGLQWPQAVTQEGMSFAPLAGVAFSSGVLPINLSPKTVRQFHQRRGLQRRLIVTGAWAAAAVVSLVLAFSVGFFKKNMQLAGMEAQLHGAKRKAFRAEEQFQKINDIEGMIQGRLIFSDFAHEIYRLLPGQVYLVALNTSDGRTLSLEGASPTSAAITQFQRDMVNSPRFAQVGLDYLNKRSTPQGDAYYFKITCTLRSP